ncbi:MAG: hypothetical protein M0D53_03310 [Flavobacterium sp. JAD_PAG50586_2]|nr:MAG: hypothetical protein M0D53_03310 [Flavobacterium sp. JAD_PAG50586_2]
MNAIIKKNGVNYGIILGVTSIVITTLVYIFDVKLFISAWITFLKVAAFTGICIALLIKTKKN